MTLPTEVLPLLQVSAPTGYNVNNSLRFRSSVSAYLNRTFGTPTSTTKQTFSFWVKRGALAGTYALFGGWDGSSASSFRAIFNSSDQISFIFGGSSDFALTTTQVFRDPSSWYNFVFSVDTTQSTASNRVILYVNGAQITVFSTANYPAQNANVQFPLANANNRVGSTYNNTSPFDGYLAEVNFIDGQTLTPSSFGAYSANGVWQPARYTGTYGANGFYLKYANQNTSTYAGTFNGSSQYLTVPDSSVWAFTGNLTLEGFFYVTTTSPVFQSIISQWVDSGGTDRAFTLGVNSSAQITGALQYGGSQYSVTSPSSSIKTGIWYHVAMVVNGTTLTLYLNGVSQSTATVSGTLNNSTAPVGVGAYGNGSYPVSGQLSNIRITNTAVYTANFTPPSANLTAITGTQLLTLQGATIVDNSSNAFTITNNGTVSTSTTTPFIYPNIAADSSGNANNWTQNNISVTAGTTYDPMLDSPTLTSATVANYAVLNPLQNGGGTASAGNLNLLGASGTWGSRVSTIAPTSGKWYFEVTPTSGSGTLGIQFGITKNAAPTSFLGADANGYSYYGFNGNKYNSNAATAYGATVADNDIVGVAFDADAGSLTFYKNNVSQGVAYSGLTFGTWYLGVSCYDTATASINFGQRPFTYTPPTGYVRLNAYNLPTPTIANGATVMAATTYAGNSSTNNINDGTNTTTAVTFKPDFVWIKNRTSALAHYLSNSVTGPYQVLFSNLTNAEYNGTSFSDGVSTFNTNGFTLLNGSNVGNYNQTANNYVAWQWQAGQGSTSSNTNGSVTSTVSVNATAGFSVVTYTGTGAVATVGHGLGVAPSMYVTKGRSGVTNWVMYHVSLGGTQQILLNTTGAATAGNWNNTAPTSTVFSLGSGSGDVNGNGTTYVAYCWSAVAGYSAFGSYTGNASADGPFIYTGFKSRFIMIKRSDAVSNWQMLDTSRSQYNMSNSFLFSNLADAESADASGGLDILSNGFKIRNAGTNSLNASGGTYIYAAFAENPFKYALAR